jgi:hypothetical protein
MSPEFASPGRPVSQRRIASAEHQVPCTRVWLSPRAASKPVKPSATQRSSAASATARWMMVNSNESAATGG